MAGPLIQNSFAAGEVAPELWGRTDLVKYKTGCAVVRNFFVDYRGGVSSRPGSLFVGPCANNATVVRNLPFIFSATDTYVIQLSQEKINFIRDGAYITETLLAITAAVSSGAGLQLTITGAGAWSVGDQFAVEGVNGLVRSNNFSGVNGRTFTVEANAAGVITLSDPISGGLIDAASWSAWVSGGTAARIYSIASPYQAEDLFDINYAQSADVLDLTHPSYPQYELQRLGAANWQLVLVTIEPSLLPPTGAKASAVVGNAPAANSAYFRYNYCVTSVNSVTNEESEISTWAGVSNYALNQDTGIQNKITWNAVANVTAYRIYKAIVVLQGTAGSPPYFVGFMGTSTETQYTDTNIEPDFTTVPPSFTNPFNSGPLSAPTVVNAGFGYISPVVMITDPTGSGAAINAVINASGSVTSANLVAGGSNYEAPTIKVNETNTTPGSGLVLAFSNSWTAVGPYWTPSAGSITISAGGTNYHVPNVVVSIAISNNVQSFTQGVYEGRTTGAIVTSLVQEIPLLVTTSDGLHPNSGATVSFAITDVNADSTDGAAIITATISGGNYPAVVSYFDQRRVYAASDNNPDTVWTSKPGSYSNFDTSYPSQADDGLVATIVGQEVNAITSLTPVAGGLIALSNNGAYLISGGSPTAALTPTTITAAAQAFSGAAALQPLRINYDIVYLQARGSAVRDLSYNFYVNVYTGSDISIISSHLFYGRTIVQWAYAEEPFKLVWGVRDDGVMLSLTFMKEQEIYGWARHDTAGQYVSVTVVPEGKEDVAYVVVKRFFNGSFAYVTERIASRFFGQNTGRNTPSNPEKVWCLDCAVQYASIEGSVGIDVGYPINQGAISLATVINSGSDYSSNPYYQIIDTAGQGSGGVLNVFVEGGRVSAVTVVDGGSGYLNPVVDIATGEGAVVALQTTNIWHFVFNTPLSSALNIGDVIRIAGGKGVITSSTVNFVEANMSVQPCELLPNTYSTVITPQAASDWSTSTPVSSIGGLDHFEGCYVGVVADGNVIAPQLVAQGAINLPAPASCILAGANYTCQFQSLRPEVEAAGTVQGRRKTIPALTLRCVDTRGISVGRDFINMTEVKERTQNDQIGQATQFQDGGGWQAAPYANGPLSPIPPGYADTRTILETVWDENGYICLQQNYPMPVTLIATIPELLLGDDPSS